MPVAVAALVGAGVLGAAEAEDVGADCITVGAVETVGADWTAFGIGVVDNDACGV